MYNFIKGIIEEKHENIVAVNCNNVGYEINMTTFGIDVLPGIGDVAKIFTYLHVKEDSLTLYGFINKDEKRIFLELINVSGIGAKTAITILSAINFNDLIKAVIANDVSAIASAKGVGKKTAERIVLELKSKFNGGDFIFDKENDIMAINNPINEAISALTNMGLTNTEASKVVKFVAKPEDKVEDIITKALKFMNN